MNLTIETLPLLSPSTLGPTDPSSLYQALEQVPDGCKRYPLALIFTLLWLGKLAGETTIQGVVEWVNLHQRELRAALDWPRRLPWQPAYTRALAHVLAQVFLKVHAQDEASLAFALDPLRQVNVDGKTLRDTMDHGQPHQPSVHVLSWYEPQTEVVLAH